VARDKGFYAAAGLDVEILPFSDSGVEAVLAAGGADFGFSGSSSLTPARAAGQKIKAVEVVLHKPGLFIGYSAKRTDITRPKDLDGKTYAGFGLPWEKAVVTQVIKADGGTANFKSVSLSTSAYEAVYSGAADFAQPLVTWEGIEAELNGTPLSYIDPRKYGVPADYTLVISGNESFLSAKPAVTKAFVQATQKGYAWAADHPAESADLLIAANPQVLKNPELVKRSQDLLSKEWFRAADGRVGFSDPAVWQGYSDWLFKNGLLTDADGNPAKEAPKAADLYTNEFLAP
jgi:ABC-type nitrate/sulfonate/bicarbonate transport system substrate-binding protein